MDIPVQIGDVLAGKYRVDRVIGFGGMGVVAAATHLQLEERVALKFLLPHAGADCDLRLARERPGARVAEHDPGRGRLDHEHRAVSTDAGRAE
jgi:eukaryotic-like serine/threonine-protein kinase